MVALSVPKLKAKSGERIPRNRKGSESFTVKGQVVDETGKPMMGVKLIKEGEMKPLFDMDGNFILDTERGISVSLLCWDKRRKLPLVSLKAILGYCLKKERVKIKS